MTFLKSESMKISINKEQEKYLSSKDSIIEGLKEKDVIAFDIFNDSELIGFVMLREFQKGCFFLWDFAIDSKFQNKGLGTKALSELIQHLKIHHNMKLMTTTYIRDNGRAEHLYKKIGFKVTEVIDEPDCQEVNMMLCE